MGPRANGIADKGGVSPCLGKGRFSKVRDTARQVTGYGRWRKMFFVLKSKRKKKITTMRLAIFADGQICDKAEARVLRSATKQHRVLH